MNNDANETKRGTYFVSSLAMTTSLTEYGISSIFTLFLIHVLHFSIPLSSSMYSQYYLFAYTLPIIVGLISDRYLSRTTSLLIGFISMIISQIILFISASLYAPSSVQLTTITFNLQNTLFIIGLAFLAMGTSFANNTFSNINQQKHKRSRNRFICYLLLTLKLWSHHRNFNNDFHCRRYKLPFIQMVIFNICNFRSNCINHIPICQTCVFGKL